MLMPHIFPFPGWGWIVMDSFQRVLLKGQSSFVQLSFHQNPKPLEHRLTSSFPSERLLWQSKPPSQLARLWRERACARLSPQNKRKATASSCRVGRGAGPAAAPPEGSRRGRNSSGLISRSWKLLQTLWTCICMRHVWDAWAAIQEQLEELQLPL